MNEIIKNLTAQNYLNLKSSFENSKDIFWDSEKKKLIHPGEFGTYREELLKKWLRLYIPKKFEISSGFLINAEGLISSQCDLIIYDRDNTPQIENIDNQKFFPIETVAAVGEVKSDINSIAELNKILIKLSEIKKLRHTIKSPRPYHPQKPNFNLERSPYSNIFTFLICNKMNFEIKVESINYGDVNKKHEHNLILSLENGIINYRYPKGGPNLAFPFMGDDVTISNFLPNDDVDLPIPITMFLTAIYTALTLTVLLEIDMVYYLTNNHT